MSIPAQVVSTTIKGLSHLLCRIDASQLPQVPQTGPLILVANHINFLDAPVVYTQLLPRPMTGFAKIETWENPLIGALFSLYRSIPLRRGQADVGAIRRALTALAAGQIVIVAPEGTRSGDGRLRRAEPGVVTLALHSRAPLLPIAFYGNETFHLNLRRLRRTDFHFAVGRQFKLNLGERRLTQSLRQEIADQIMYQMAALLPQEYRGYYADLAKARSDFFCFDPV
jgi:1-acyl-sn-glycerol-3-phosphate acyltransferase